MRSAETVLGIIHQRGRQGLPLEDVYRQLYNPDLFLRAYQRIASNRGAMTRGATPETVDGMSQAKIAAIIDALRHERHRWTPVRRVYIEKKGSTKLRPLGLPTWSDKLLQEVIRSILEAYYEPQFSPYSHGFRPQRGCHTALTSIRERWHGTVWLVEGDISRCFDSISHEILLGILGEKIRDSRFLRLIANLLKAGYLEDWKYHQTLSGSPQGGIVSPILSNIYLDRLDQFVVNHLLPAHNRGHRRKGHPAYMSLHTTARNRIVQGRLAEALALRKQAKRFPSGAHSDPGFRRLRYVRYADDFMLGFVGPYQEAEAIKQRLGEFLREELKLELSPTKTLITHAPTQAARFLGYDIAVQRSAHRRSVNGAIALRVPADVLRAKRKPYMYHGKPMGRLERLSNTVFSTIEQYQAEFRGVVEYYRLALNLHKMNHLQWVMRGSLLKTLAQKLKLSVMRVCKRYKTTIRTKQGTYVILQETVERGSQRKPLVARFGGISLRYRRHAELNDQPALIRNKGTELLERLLADICEHCGSQEHVEVHHIRALKDLKRPGRPEKPEWKRIMAARKRKTLVVCSVCHHDIHNGRVTAVRETGEPDDRKRSSPVRRGADAKVPV